MPVTNFKFCYEELKDKSDERIFHLSIQLNNINDFKRQFRSATFHIFIIIYCKYLILYKESCKNFNGDQKNVRLFFALGTGIFSLPE